MRDGVLGVSCASERVEAFVPSWKGSDTLLVWVRCLIAIGFEELVGLDKVVVPGPVAFACGSGGFVVVLASFQVAVQCYGLLVPLHATKNLNVTTKNLNVTTKNLHVTLMMMMIMSGHRAGRA